MSIENIQIEKGVKIPPHNQQAEIMNTFRAMEVGDSFRVNAQDVGVSFAQSVFKYAKRIGIKITTRTEEEGETSFYRVWRVK